MDRLRNNVSQLVSVCVLVGQKAGPPYAKLFLDRFMFPQLATRNLQPVTRNPHHKFHLC